MNLPRRSILPFMMIFSATLLAATLAAAQDVTLKNARWTVVIQPGSLRVTVEPRGRKAFQLSDAQTDLGAARRVTRQGDLVHWDLPAKAATVSMQLRESELTVRIRASKEGSFTWPVFQGSKPLKALVWPRWEGCYVPLDDAEWVQYLIDYGKWNTLEGLTMPFWGFDCGGYMLTCIVTNPCNNEITFGKKNSQLAARFTHEFASNNAVKEYGFSIRLSESSSPIEPAREFRRWLVRSGRFVSMREKLKSVPKAERLLGAPHVYLWGDGFFTRHDIPARQWAPFCRKLVAQSNEAGDSVGKRIKAGMAPAHWAEVVQLAGAQWPDSFTKGEIAAELSRLLERPDFYEEPSWKGIALPDEAARLLRRERSTLTTAELCRLNGLLLRAAYPEALADVNDWGDGVSMRMLKAFEQAGFDRMRLCVGGWSGIEKRPEVAAQADKMGYLFGTYDSFHSIHDPRLRGTDSTWETAQFDADLYEKGPIVGKDGRKLRGFKQAGYKLSPIAARPAVEKRVNENLRRVPYSYYFVDCDAFGEVFDDYSPLHPATQARDIAARNDRLAWISGAHHVVVGSEGGSAYAAPVVHLVEGVFQPDMGWGDPDLKDKKSKYYTGAYYPPDGPKCFVQPVPLKAIYERTFYDPRFRLPLYEVVFHDSVVTGHHWSAGSLKYQNVLDTVALTELLYQVPPLYHLNLDEFVKSRDAIKKHYAFFSPLHRALGFTPMTDFAWLTSDRLVQRTLFGDQAELVANFGARPFDYQGTTIPARSILARWLKSGKKELFTPAPSPQETSPRSSPPTFP